MHHLSPLAVHIASRVSARTMTWDFPISTMSGGSKLRKRSNACVVRHMKGPPVTGGPPLVKACLDFKILTSATAPIFTFSGEKWGQHSTKQPIFQHLVVHSDQAAKYPLRPFPGSPATIAVPAPFRPHRAPEEFAPPAPRRVGQPRQSQPSDPAPYPPPRLSR